MNRHTGFNSGRSLHCNAYDLCSFGSNMPIKVILFPFLFPKHEHNCLLFKVILRMSAVH